MSVEDSPDRTPPAAFPAVPAPALIRFGVFQLDLRAAQLLRGGRVVPLKPQPFKVLRLLASRPGEVVTREEIRHLLWGTDTFVDFEQGVNTALKQVREALGDVAERPLYVETVPKRGYRFIAPVEPASGSMPVPDLRKTDLNLQKALWLNIAEMRLAEARRRRLRRRLLLSAGIVAVALALAALVAALLS